MLSTLMLVGLGFLTASLVAILIIPWVWRRAVKVTGRRLQFAAPDSVIEVQADRDQLRAEHALSTRKLELRLRDIKEKLTRQAVEHSENVQLVEQLREQLEKKEAEIARRGTEIEQLRASMSPIETELASRTSTVQQLRETVRRAEDKVREQESMIKQTVQAAGLSDAEIEALREASRLEAAGKILLPGLDSTRETLTEQVAALAGLAEEMEAQRAQIFEHHEQVEQQRSEIASSKSISAQEAKSYQGRISALEAERGKLDADLKEAVSRATKLHEDVSELDVAWQNRDNPYRELKARLDAVVADVERISKTLHRESIVKSVLAALPGGKAAAKKPEAPKPPAVAVVAAAKPASRRKSAAVSHEPEQSAGIVADAAAQNVLRTENLPVPAETPAAVQSKAVIRLPSTTPGPAAIGAAPSEPQALEPARKSARTRNRTRRVRTLAERIRALQEEIN